MLTTAPETSDGKPVCYCCNGPATPMEAGRFSRKGVVLTCLDCGTHCLEPTRIALTRMQAEIDRLRKRLEAAGA